MEHLVGRRRTLEPHPQCSHCVGYHARIPAYAVVDPVFATQHLPQPLPQSDAVCVVHVGVVFPTHHCTPASAAAASGATLQGTVVSAVAGLPHCIGGARRLYGAPLKTVVVVLAGTQCHCIYITLIMPTPILSGKIHTFHPISNPHGARTLAVHDGFGDPHRSAAHGAGRAVLALALLLHDCRAACVFHGSQFTPKLCTVPPCQQCSATRKDEITLGQITLERHFYQPMLCSFVIIPRTDLLPFCFFSTCLIVCAFTSYSSSCYRLAAVFYHGPVTLPSTASCRHMLPRQGRGSLPKAVQQPDTSTRRPLRCRGCQAVVRWRPLED